MFRLAVAIVLAGIGHYFVAFQRDIYPLDGYVYYAAAAIFLTWALRSARDLPGVDRSALRKPLRRIAVELRRLASAFFDSRFGPILFLGLITLNLISAVLALLVNSWIVFVGWGISVAWLVATVWPRLAHTPTNEAVLPQSSDTIFEAAEVPLTETPRAAVMIIGLLAVVLGQAMIAIDKAPDVFGAFGDIANSIAEAVQLQLPSDAGPA